MTTESLLAYQKNIGYQRRIRLQALAILQRARDAGIPEDQWRIGELPFSKMLDPYFYGGEKEKDAFASNIFQNANSLFDKRFIIIDGGTRPDRLKAGFAILFRLIACDRNGKWENFGKFVHAFGSFKSLGDVSRNEYAEIMSNYDNLFLSEFERKMVTEWGETASFIDEVFEQRYINKRLTIVSFVRNLSAKNSDHAEVIMENTCGEYISLLSKCDIGECPLSVLRIRINSSFGG